MITKRFGLFLLLFLAFFAKTTVLGQASADGIESEERRDWKPYRQQKLFEADRALRDKSNEFELEFQPIPEPKRTPAPPSRIRPSDPPSERVEPPTKSEPAVDPSPEPKTKPAPREAIPEEREPPSARIPEADPFELDGQWSPRAQPASGEYLDEFDLMPPIVEEEFLEESFVIDGPPVLTKFKKGFFQKLSLTSTIVDPAASSGFGMTEVETALSVAVPAPTTDYPLIITPSFDARFLSGPRSVDVPEELFTTGVDFTWIAKLTPRLRTIVGVAPMVFSDFEASHDEALRVTGRAFVQWDAIPERLQFVAGVLYLNREDVRLLPAAGLTWSPNPWWNFELIFPRPKFSRLVRFGANHQDWIYLLGEFGGNTWSVLRDTGATDKLTLRDIRCMLGIERKWDGGRNLRFEVGYVFAREVDYASTVHDDVTPADTLLLRLGVTF